MSEGRMLRPGARIAGAVLLAALALLDLAWIARDFGQASDVTDAWWMWSGLIFRAQDGIWASSFVEPTMLVLYTVCAVTAAVSSAAAGVLVSTGVLTVLVRVPTLWNLNASWVKGGVSDSLRNLVLTTVITMLVAGVALIVLGAAGRRRVPETGGHERGGDSGDGAEPAPAPRDEPPARPTPAGALTASVLLAAVAAVLVIWEIHAVDEQGWELYSRHFTGDRALATLLAVPESWYGCALILVSLGATAAAFVRAPYSRPLGMTVCGPLLGLGLFRLSFGAKSGLLGAFGGLDAREQLWLCTAAFEVLAALAVVLALAGRDAGTPETVTGGGPHGDTGPGTDGEPGSGTDSASGGEPDGSTDSDTGPGAEGDSGPSGHSGGEQDGAPAPRLLTPSAGTDDKGTTATP